MVMNTHKKRHFSARKWQEGNERQEKGKRNERQEKGKGNERQEKGKERQTDDLRLYFQSIQREKGIEVEFVLDQKNKIIHKRSHFTWNFITEMAV